MDGMTMIRFWLIAPVLVAFYLLLSVRTDPFKLHESHMILGKTLRVLDFHSSTPAIGRGSIIGKSAYPFSSRDHSSGEPAEEPVGKDVSFDHTAARQ